MEKLIVRNFGPIKEAEIELTKYVVFIGDTSTGKSVLGKLISILRYGSHIFDINLQGIEAKSEFDFSEQLKYYNIDFDFKNAIIKYHFNDLIILLDNERISYFKNSEKIKIDIEKNENDFFTNLIRVSNTSTYIPPDRMLLSMIGNSLSGLWANNVALPDYFKSFAGRYEVARKEIKYIDFNSFGFTFSFENGATKIVFRQQEFLLSKASSGIQSLIPLLIAIEYELKLNGLNRDKTIFIEEPELNLFPIKQKKLLEHIIGRFFDKRDKLIFTTHSPYILTVLDTFILAKNIFNEHPDLKEEINTIVPENNWIDYDEISIYEVKNDGKVSSLKNEEFKSIDTNAIDSVSDIISDEFDKLVELRYAH